MFAPPLFRNEFYLIDSSVNGSHVRHQFGSIGKRFAAHGTFSSSQRSSLFGVTLHVTVYRHLCCGFEVTETTLELFDSNFVNAPDVLLQEPSVLGNVTALATFVRWFSVVRSFVSVNIFDVNIHILFASAFVVAIGTVKGFEPFVN